MSRIDSWRFSIAQGNAANAKLNGEYAAHVTPFEKKHTAKIRRAAGKREAAAQVANDR